MGKRNKTEVIYNFKKQLKLKNLLLGEVVNLIIKEVGGNQCCISASWLVSGILSAYSRFKKIPQLYCEPRFISLFIVNDIGMEFSYKYYKKVVKLLRMGKEPENTMDLSNYMKGIKKDKRIWVIGNLLNNTTKQQKYEGYFHSAIVFRDGSILDLTIDQMSRPKKNLFIDKFWVKRINLPKNIVLFRVEKRIDQYGAISVSPNLQEVTDTISSKIAKILKCPMLTISDKRKEVISQEEWEKFRNLNKSQILKPLPEKQELYEQEKGTIKYA